MPSSRFELEHLAKPSVDDDALAALIALAIVETEPEVYRLGIDHDVRAAACRKGGPKTGRAPVPYDWAHRELIGIETRHKHVAIHWATLALKAGYYVRIVGKDHTDAVPGYGGSIERCRRRIEYANRPQVAGADDDDIPF